MGGVHGYQAAVVSADTEFEPAVATNRAAKQILING